jgi:hypothetical protein
MRGIRVRVRPPRPPLRAASQAIRRACAGPGRERDLAVQAAKAALAAWIAWAVASWWLKAPMAFMAPWVAIVLVESTVYRSIAHGLQQVAAIAAGTVLATAVALPLHDNLLAMALVLPTAVLLGHWRRLGSQGIYSATGALFVLTNGTVSLTTSTARIAEAVFGAVVGITVNALIRPPVYLHDTRAVVHDATEEAHDLLEAVADGLTDGRWDTHEADTWHARALHLQHLVDRAHDAVRWSRESLRVNLRRRTRAAPSPGQDHDDTVVLLDHAAVHTAGLTRTIREAAADHGPAIRLDPALARHYARFLRRTAHALRLHSQSRWADRSDHDLREVVHDLHTSLDALRRHPPRPNPENPSEVATYGALLTQAHRLAHQFVTTDV